MRSVVIGLVALGAVAWTGVSGAQCEGGRCTGDSNGDGVVDIAELVQAVNVALSGCTERTCQAPLPAGDCRLPASGQVTSYGPGSDGDVRAGFALSYTDNGDGTITDNNTGLMWEKKDNSGGIHGKDNRYTWGSEIEPYMMDGSMVTNFLARLNAAPCFAGHCDWRIPNVKELHSMVDYEIPFPGPLVHPAFDIGCAAGCTVDGVGGPMCSCTISLDYWSSTADTDTPDSAWNIDFDDGFVDHDPKGKRRYVRAVRGGL